MKTATSGPYGTLAIVFLLGTICAAMGLSFAAEPKAPEKGNTLIEAAFRADVAKIKLLLDEGVDVNLAMADGFTALIEACTHPRATTAEAVKLLLERGAKVNVVSDMGMTPLAGAVHTVAGIETVKLLVDHGADVNAAVRLTVPDKPTRVLTVLRIATQGKDLPLVSFLLEKGADANCRDPHGQTALMVAAWEGQLEIAKILLEKGAQVNVKDNFGQTPLGLANQRGHKQVIELLVQHGAKE